ncbi:MAG: AMP-binding protein [Bdellovibrio sp.]|nr:AMP-binding protein [Bdellovibrio sp.]
MATAEAKLDLSSNANEILLNPRWPVQDYANLENLALWAQEKENLRGHVWLATSGSTADSIGATKLVALAKHALQASAEAVNKHLQSTAEDVWTQVLPHYHVGGLGIELRAQLSGAKVVSALRNQRWDALYFYEILKQEKCTLSALVPTQIYDLVGLNLQAPTHLRAVVVGGGVFELELYKKARALGWPVLPSYGMTETASQIATASLASLQQMDYPEMPLLPHAQARTNAEGFLQVQATSLFSFYAQNTSEGPKVWDPKKGGWFQTEDRGEVVAGSLFVQGRSKDYIKIGGEGVNLARLRSALEQCLLKYDAKKMSQIVLLDMASERLGAEVHLVSTLPESETLALQRMYEEQVLPFEKIRKIHYVKEIPRNDLGKVLWSSLRSQL